ncbi:MAG TPA: hypothetical protein VMH81_16085 [Bryobacteraceae bacterium]|nr:hypothetical protein [Bryobacteraceae bacterium]
MTSTELIDCQSLPPGSLLEVETRNRHYQIEYLGAGAIRICGHPEYCPTPVPAQLRGSADKSGVIEPGLIGCGRYLQFLVDEHLPVTTSRVMKVRVERPRVVSSPQSSSVH